MGKDKAEDVKGRSDKEEEGTGNSKKQGGQIIPKKSRKRKGLCAKMLDLLRKHVFPKGKKRLKVKVQFFSLRK